MLGGNPPLLPNPPAPLLSLQLAKSHRWPACLLCTSPQVFGGSAGPIPSKSLIAWEKNLQDSTRDSTSKDYWHHGIIASYRISPKTRDPQWHGFGFGLHFKMQYVHSPAQPHNVRAPAGGSVSLPRWLRGLPEERGAENCSKLQNGFNIGRLACKLCLEDYFFMFVRL